jgi:hypothetical protein
MIQAKPADRIFHSPPDNVELRIAAARGVRHSRSFDVGLSVPEPSWSRYRSDGLQNLVARNRAKPSRG